MFHYKPTPRSLNFTYKYIVRINLLLSEIYNFQEETNELGCTVNIPYYADCSWLQTPHNNNNNNNNNITVREADN